jgi:hypothetical protein
MMEGQGSLLSGYAQMRSIWSLFLGYWDRRTRTLTYSNAYLYNNLYAFVIYKTFQSQMDLGPVAVNL